MRQPVNDDYKDLEGFLDELMCVQALAGSWNGCGPRHIATTLLEAVVRLLDLDFAYARVEDSKGNRPLELISLGRYVGSNVPAAEVGRALGSWLRGDASGSASVVPNPVAEGTVSISILRLGVQEGIGSLVAGSRRADFPAMTERVLLRAAASEAALALQRPRALKAQKRNPEGAERYVVVPAAQRAAASDELRKDAAKREQAEAEALATKRQLTTELAAMTALHELSTRLLSQSDLHVLLEELLEATMALLHADSGNVRLYNAETRALEIVAQRGFEQEVPDYSGAGDFCAAILHDRQRVVVEDVLTDPILGLHPPAVSAVSYRAVQPTPLFNRRGEPLGMISTYFRRPHRPYEHELRLADLYARQAAQLIERTRAEKELVESELRFRLLAESIPHHVWCVRSDGTAAYWNRRLSEYTGLTDEELRSGGWAALHPDDVARVKAAWEMVRTQGTGYQMEQRLRGRDGRYRRFMCRGVAVGDGQGRPVEWCGTSTDIEERRQAEEALHKARTELAHVTRVTAMGELAASIAHEVNQPLAAIVANGHACAHWLSADPPNLREASQSAERIVRDANRASQVVSRIRAFLKRGESRLAPLDIEEIVREAMDMTQGEIRAHGVHLSLTASADLPPVLGDRIQLQQVVLNLVMNAVEAMEPVTERPRMMRVEIARCGAETVRVAVCDSGIGLDPGRREEVFDAFHTTKPGGMGMGLAVSRSIIEAHRGRLWTTPNEGPGETFQFTVPLAVPATP